MDNERPWRIGIRREPHPYGYVWRARWITGAGAGQAVGTAGPGGHGQLLINMCNHQAGIAAVSRAIEAKEIEL